MTTDADEARRQTVMLRGAQIHRAAWSNLRHARDEPKEWVYHRDAWRGTTAVIVGAGSSLDDDWEVLRDLAPTSLVITVNTALGALQYRGFDADVMVTLESLDLTHQWVGKTGAFTIAGLGSHPSAFAAADAALLETSPAHMTIARELGVPMLAFGGSAMTAAYSLARFAGCSPILLLGMDLCVLGGRAYARGAGWDGLTVARDGDELVFTGREDRDEVHRAGGIPPQPRRRPVVERDGCVTYDDLAIQADWFREHVTTDTINLTRGGLDLGCRRGMSARRTAEPPPNPRTLVAPGDCSPVPALLEQARYCREYATRMLSGDPVDLAGFARGVEFVEALCHPDWLGLARLGLASDADLRARYEVLLAAATEVLDGA